MCSSFTISSSLQKDCTLPADGSYSIFVRDLDNVNIGSYNIYLQSLTNPVATPTPTSTPSPTPTPIKYTLTVTKSGLGNKQWRYIISHFFWSQIYNGVDIYNSFVDAKNGIGFSASQTPQIDDNGNGIGYDRKWQLA